MIRLTEAETRELEKEILEDWAEKNGYLVDGYLSKNWAENYKITSGAQAGSTIYELSVDGDLSKKWAENYIIESDVQGKCTIYGLFLKDMKMKMGDDQFQKEFSRRRRQKDAETIPDPTPGPSTGYEPSLS